MSQHLSEQEIVRREKLKELQALGIEAYPAALYPVSFLFICSFVHYLLNVLWKAS